MSEKRNLAALVVDDDWMVRKLVERVAREVFERVETAEDGMRALSLIEKERYDVVISDLKMPGVGGLDVIRSARVRDPSTVLIVITGFAETADESAIRACGAELLRKPFGAAELEGVLRRAAG